MSFDDSYYEYYDKYEQYEELFDPSRTDRKARRSRKPKAKHVPKKSHNQVIAELVDQTTGLEGGFITTYRPSRYEEGWLLDSLRSFYDRGLINDIIGVIKGGKEASVYRCAADPATGASMLAAKVYRPRQFRNLRNDSMYRQGRAILDPYGHDHDFARDQRVARAIDKKTAFGMQVRHTSWLMHEYTALERLYEAGAAVPQPVAASENAILMGYCGDNGTAAPTLTTTTVVLSTVARTQTATVGMNRVWARPVTSTQRKRNSVNLPATWSSSPPASSRWAATTATPTSTATALNNRCIPST